MSFRYLLPAFCVLQFWTSIQTYGQSRLEIGGDVSSPLSLSTTDLRSFRPYTDSVIDRDNMVHVFRGVSLIEVLRKAGAPPIQQMRGENLLKIILVTAADGYQVVFTLPEVDPEFTGRHVLIAFEKDGKPLPPGEGTFRLIAAADMKKPRWIREVRSIKIVYPKE